MERVLLSATFSRTECSQKKKKNQLSDLDGELALQDLCLKFPMNLTGNKG